MIKQNLISKAVRLALMCGMASGLAGKAALAADQDATATTTDKIPPPNWARSK